jgi:late competence protein required for DNA uptake (superfamily II DNA/RNA helicase)
MKNKNKCAFCGNSTNYFLYELACYICPKCIGEYRKASAVPVHFDDYQTIKKEE